MFFPFNLEPFLHRCNKSSNINLGFLDFPDYSPDQKGPVKITLLIQMLAKKKGALKAPRFN
ncbi:MAG: hypothetical protein A2508_04045 [Candidatus Lambdaproteobacteria bacterium RIFOXYD12_FULL_49_8]|uniref:Uncharacterized protein n=1 Tax=Candidatus Lambdaproteobacteria bacterium RIFOXYD2_FULL_50_16 TaxID=1817772 RepID=A0A1F6G6K9_9PROT|nr:MAG: hypothetical protein A2527_11510 [Candidatus Lambdaproteobacteria bacterium RIFOXYD2_FULL_50_16]OGG97124.1 MAG: hypothetical protein A2508_04045 [Candidatus Lambdaproteobacteria bacterium RIFOXYD12_FULL_49_8]